MQYSASKLQYEHMRHRCKMLDDENQKLMRMQSDVVNDANRRVQVSAHLTLFLFFFISISIAHLLFALWKTGSHILMTGSQFIRVSALYS